MTGSDSISLFARHLSLDYPHRLLGVSIDLGFLLIPEILPSMFPLCLSVFPPFILILPVPNSILSPHVSAHPLNRGLCLFLGYGLYRFYQVTLRRQRQLDLCECEADLPVLHIELQYSQGFTERTYLKRQKNLKLDT